MIDVSARSDDNPMAPSRGRVLVSWSSGKDCAWALHALRQQGGWDITGLLTTFNDAVDRVAMHAVRRSLVEAQAKATMLPLWSVPLPYPCSNDEYAARMRVVVDRAVADGVTHVAFGDLFLEDVRDYRIRMLEGTGLTPIFPLFGTAADTPALAARMQAEGVRAVVTCVDPKQLRETAAGREWNAAFLADLPPNADPCGERGEFHTFCYAAPVFDAPIAIRVGDRLERDGFVFADVLPV
jgi:diphthamide synthase (EF-2-diphthine--ammonia ligase)